MWLYLIFAWRDLKISILPQEEKDLEILTVSAIH